MDATLINTIIAAIAVIVTIAITFIGAWIQLNSRISVLEVQVKNDHQALQDLRENIDEMKSMLTDIQIGVQHLQDVKADKR